MRLSLMQGVSDIELQALMRCRSSEEVQVKSSPVGSAYAILKQSSPLLLRAEVRSFK